jgi:hypothetical protein
MRHLDFARAKALLLQPGYVLQEVKNVRKSEFAVIPGGPVTETVARKLLAHRRCRVVDPGLFLGMCGANARNSRPPHKTASRAQ